MGYLGCEDSLQRSEHVLDRQSIERGVKLGGSLLDSCVFYLNVSLYLVIYLGDDKREVTALKSGDVAVSVS